jgi:chromosomal replication initiator protein
MQDSNSEGNEKRSIKRTSSSPEQLSADNKTGSGQANGSTWQESVAELQGQLDPHIFSAYIKPLKFSSYDSSCKELTITAPSRLVCNHVDKNLKERITDALSNQLGVHGVDLKISVENSSLDGAFEKKPASSSQYIVVKKKNSSPSSKLLKERSQANNINSKYTFDNFVVGNSNQFCHAAAMQVADDPGNAYNPLFIYGGVGLGKTHLLHAIGNAVLARKPEANIMYLSSETFTNELIQSLRFAKMDEFKNRLRNIELLLIDDIQFMCGKERTQEEFFHTFNALYNAKHQIVITSDKIPQDIPGIEERLQTRFAWGLTADLQSPDFETRVAILNRKANLDTFDLPVDVAHFIAENISSNVRELEGALTRLHAMSSLQNLQINMELAKTALRPLVKSRAANISVDEIKKVVSDHFNIKVSEMVSKRRTKNLSFPRHIAMYLCRKHTTCSYPEIGGHFGGRDHSSVIHAANVVSTKLKNDPDVQRHIEDIEVKLLQC